MDLTELKTHSWSKKEKNTHCWQLTIQKHHTKISPFSGNTSITGGDKDQGNKKQERHRTNQATYTKMLPWLQLSVTTLLERRTRSDREKKQYQISHTDCRLEEQQSGNNLGLKRDRNKKTSYLKLGWFFVRWSKKATRICPKWRLFNSPLGRERGSDLCRQHSERMQANN